MLSDIKLAVDDRADRARDRASSGSACPTSRSRRSPGTTSTATIEPDHLTSLYIPALAAPIAGRAACDFAELVRALRARVPVGREQTHESLERYLLEETYEVLDAIDVAATPTHLEEELGDLLFQVVFHATIAAEEGWFTLADVARGIHDKLVARHPHVFGDVEVADVDELASNWERRRPSREGPDVGAWTACPPSLPALLLAAKVQQKAGSVGVEPAPGSIRPRRPTARARGRGERRGRRSGGVAARPRRRGRSREHPRRRSSRLTRPIPIGPAHGRHGPSGPCGAMCRRH